MYWEAVHDAAVDVGGGAIRGNFRQRNACAFSGRSRGLCGRAKFGVDKENDEWERFSWRGFKLEADSQELDATDLRYRCLDNDVT